MTRRLSQSQASGSPEAHRLKRSRGLEIEHRPGQTYDEDLFRYFLTIERKRLERTKRSLLLVLVRLKKGEGTGNNIGPALAARLFTGLWLCIREVDFAGWYRQQRVAGAVLAQGEELTSSETTRLIRNRLMEALRKQLPARVAGRLQLRVVPLRPRQTT
jgi:hypothetical protein